MNQKSSRSGPRAHGAAFLPVGFALAALVIVFSAGCKTFNTYSADSRPVSKPITIDGKTDDWQGDLYVVPNERMSIGFLNDRENLYICLLSSDATIRAQIMTQGFTVWFDPKGGKEKAFGIRYPLGSQGGRQPGQKPGAPPGEMKEPPTFDPSAEALGEFEIVKSEKDPVQRLAFSDIKGLEMRVASSTGLIVYEMKIPLAAGADIPVAVGAAPGQAIGIGFETGKPEAPKTPGGAGSGAPGGRGGAGRPPAGGEIGGQGDEGGMRGGMGSRMGMIESLKVWALVQLSAGSAARPAEVLSLVK